MRPAEYTDEQIIAAGKQLSAEGRRVTGFALRTVVGGGNPTRLASVWDHYLRSQQVVDAEPVQELPVELEETFREMTESFVRQFRDLALALNFKAVQTAERRVADVMKTAKEQQAQAEAELVDAAATVEDLEEQLAEAQKRSDDLAAELREARKEAQAQARELGEMRQSIAVQSEKLEAERAGRLQDAAKLDQQAGMIADLKADKADLKRQYDAMKEERDQQQQAHAVAQQQFAQLQGQHGDLKETAAAAAEKLANAEAAQQKLAEQVQVLERTVDELQARTTEAERAHAAAEARAAEQARQIAHYEGQDKSPRRPKKPEGK